MYKTIKLTDFENRMLQVLCEDELKNTEKIVSKCDLDKAKMSILQNLILKLEEA
jgi:hypothetical protein